MQSSGCAAVRQWPTLSFTPPPPFRINQSLSYGLTPQRLTEDELPAAVGSSASSFFVNDLGPHFAKSFPLLVLVGAG